MNDSVWLSDSEQHLWRTWLRVNALLQPAINRELQRDDLSGPDFAVLVCLTEAPQDRLRVSDLGRQLQWEKSRLSHHLGRMAKRGLVLRSECPEDARGAFIAATHQGRAAIEKAAPHHVSTVRRLMFDGMEVDEAEVVQRFLDRIKARLEADPVDPCKG